MKEPAASTVDGPPGAARAFVGDLVRTLRTWRLYGEGHANVETALARLQHRLATLLEAGPLALQLDATRVRVDDVVVHEAESQADVCPCLLYDHGVVGFVFEPGIPPAELREFVRVLACEPDEATDYPTVLWEADLRAIRVLVDAFEEDDAWTTPAEFAEQLATLGDDEDAPAGEDYDGERTTLEERDPGERPAWDDAQARLGESDALKLEFVLADRGYADTVGHALRVVLSMTREELDPVALAGLEKTIGPLVDALCGAGAFEAAADLLQRAERLVASASPGAIEVASHAMAAFRRPEVVERMLAALEHADSVDAEPLRAWLAHVGAPAAGPAAQWLLETRHAVAAIEAVRVLGEALVHALVPLYRTAAGEARERAGSALFEVGTPGALRELAADFHAFDEPRRLRFLKLIDRSTEPGLRRIVISALEDPSAAVRLAAVAAVRRTDAPQIAPVLQAMLDTRVFESAATGEVDAFFEMAARIGDAGVAHVLASQCVPRGLAGSFRRLGDRPRRCLRALLRMRSPAGRAVVDELARAGPRPVRDAIEELRSEAELES